MIGGGAPRVDCPSKYRSGVASRASAGVRHIAQFNIARLRHPLGHPLTRPFEDLIDETNARAEASPGFVWRHGIDTRAPDEDVYNDPLVTVNLSVWVTVDDLKNYVYGGFHRDVFRRRKEWFDSSAVVLWWVDEGVRPPLEEGRRRLDHYMAHGASDTGFGFRDVGRFPPGG